MNDDSTRLLGTWESDPNDIIGSEAYGKTTLQFYPSGVLLYVIRERDRDQIARLTYRVDSDYIVTDQPSNPRTERTRFELITDDVLVLHYAERASRYLRVK